MSVLSRLRLPSPPLTTLLRRRTFGSAAAIDHDYYYNKDEDEEEEEIKNYGKMQMIEDSEMWVPRRGVQWVIMGDPMAKRHVYAHKLSKLLDVPHISMGCLVRQELHPSSSLYKKIASAVNEGKLVPEDVIFGLLSKRLEEGHNRGESGFILDGIPRTRMQAEILDQMADIDLVVNLKCTEESLFKNYLGNGLPFISQEFYGMAKSSFNLDLDGMKPSSVDLQAIWKKKSHTYMEQIKPLEDYYKKQRKLLDFHVAGPPGDCFQGLLAALHLQHLNAMSASQKLTA
ncbi:nucleotide kinase [Lithospermum erythrorhizon]|uniref:adenylate kinase n=1 Tax=Lithospermum erythrorhizon TaxID=34254 RepID=A0AAV3P3Q8_LITER